MDNREYDDLVPTFMNLIDDHVERFDQFASAWAIQAWMRVRPSAARARKTTFILRFRGG